MAKPRVLLDWNLNTKQIDITETLKLQYGGKYVYLRDQYPELHINNLDDLKGKKIHVVLGSSPIADFQAAGLIVDKTSKHENNIKKLYARRVDFIYTLDLTAISLIEKHFPGQPSVFEIFEYQRSAADLIVRKNSLEEKLLQIFRTGLKTIIEDGTYHKIMEQTYGADQVPASAQVKSSEIKWKVYGLVKSLQGRHSRESGSP